MKVYHDDLFMGFIPSFDEDGGNRFYKVFPIDEKKNIFRVVTIFPDRGHFKIFYDIGFSKFNNVFILNKISFEYLKWMDDYNPILKYCYIDVFVKLESFTLNNIRSMVQKLQIEGEGVKCIELNEFITFEKTY